MTSDDRTDFDLDETDRLLTTTKQVRKRLDLDRPVPRALILECIDIAQHAPMGGNLERNRWLVVDDPDLKSAIAGYYEQVGRPYLAANAEAGVEGRQARGPGFGDAVAMLPVGFYPGCGFTPAPRRPAGEITYFNRWKQTS